jgi:hypothetical protein
MPPPLLLLLLLLPHHRVWLLLPWQLLYLLLHLDLKLDHSFAAVAGPHGQSQV